VVEQAIRRSSAEQIRQPVQSKPRGLHARLKTPLTGFAQGKADLLLTAQPEANALPATAKSPPANGLRKDAGGVTAKTASSCTVSERTCLVESMNINRSVDDDDDENAVQSRMITTPRRTGRRTAFTPRLAVT
jgi:hypothetical protein